MNFIVRVLITAAIAYALATILKIIWKEVLLIF